MDRPYKIIAVCGIDGAGKSTLIDMLKKDLNGNEYVYPKKKIHINSNLINNYINPFRNSNSYYFRTNSYGCAFDFLAHYDESIKPYLLSNNVLICDRYKYCYLAYAYQVSSTFGDICHLLKTVPEADYVLYIDTDPSIAQKRLDMREEKINDLKGFAKAYKHLFKSYKNVIRIENNDNLSYSYGRFRSELLKIL